MLSVAIVKTARMALAHTKKPHPNAYLAYAVTQAR